MKFNNIKVYNFEGALFGMRNPKNSWHLSDSKFGFGPYDWADEDCQEVARAWTTHIWGENNFSEDDVKEQCKKLWSKGIIKDCDEMAEWAFIGPKDMKLAKALINGGPEHRKFLRQIFVSVDLTCPIFWFKEFDTYKVGTVANSTSTMHTIQTTPITLESFEIGDYNPVLFGNKNVIEESLIPYLENLRVTYNKLIADARLMEADCPARQETMDKAKKVWKELIRWTPESWLQTRTVTMSYENLLAMCSKGQRRFHKLTEWSIDFMNFARSLPYAQDFIFIDEE